MSSVAPTSCLYPWPPVIWCDVAKIDGFNLGGEWHNCVDSLSRCIRLPQRFSRVVRFTYVLCCVNRKLIWPLLTRWFKLQVTVAWWRRSFSAATTTATSPSTLAVVCADTRRWNMVEHLLTGKDPLSGLWIRSRQVWFHRAQSFRFLLYYIDFKSYISLNVHVGLLHQGKFEENTNLRTMQITTNNNTHKHANSHVSSQDTSPFLEQIRTLAWSRRNQILNYCGPSTSTL